jgi:hypothetical protein
MLVIEKGKEERKVTRKNRWMLEMVVGCVYEKMR